MCGIVGAFHFHHDHPVREEHIRAMADQIIHRGPNDWGAHTDGPVGIGMRRLSIIDLEGGHQPMYSADGRKAIVFNGEVYNFGDLRPGLQTDGFHFATHSDTEVVLRSYERDGTSFLDQLNGMYGLAIWDADERRLLLARDRIGIKPLYYYQDDEKLVFGSEIKSILAYPGVTAELDHAALGNYLCHGFTPAPQTLFRRIRKVRPAHYLDISHHGVRELEYWRPRYADKDRRPLAELQEELYEILRSAVRYQMIADVPLGAFLSGGFDSSGIVHIMDELGAGPVSTYTVGFGKGFAQHNEISPARRFAKDYGTDHHEIEVHPDVADLFPRLIASLDEPVADSSFVLTYLISALAKETSTVILSGVGGDELFGGYRRYLNVSLAQTLGRIPATMRNFLINPALGLLPVDRNHPLFNQVRLARAYFATASLSPEEQYRAYTRLPARDLMNTERAERQLSDAASQLFDECDSTSPLDRIMYYDLKTSLPEQLLMLTDKMSMATSLEARVPYLDHRIVEFAARLPDSARIKGMKLRVAQKGMLRGRIPDYVFEQKKKGFGAPMGAWLRNDLNEMARDLLSPARINAQGLFNGAAVERVLDEHQHMREDHTDTLLCLLGFQLWHDSYMRH